MPEPTNLLIRDYVRELICLLDEIDDEKADAFDRGRKFGLAQAASVLMQEAQAFGIDRQELGLEQLERRTDLGLH
jgi:hypothetical protein